MAPGREGEEAPGWGFLAPLVLAVAIIGGSLMVGHRSHLLTLERREAADTAELAEVAAGFAADMRRVLDSVEAVAQGGAPLPVQVSGTLAAIVTAAPNGSSPVLSEADVTNAEVVELLDQARDSGATEVSAPIALEAGTRTLVVAAQYDPTQLPPTSPAQRRQRLARWYVTTVDLAALAAAHQSEDRVASAHDVAGDPPSDVPTRLPDVAVDVAGRRFEVTAGTPSAPGVTPPSLAIAVSGALFGLLCAGWVWATQRRAHRVRAELIERSEQVQLIAEVAPLVQRSLDLAEVLPAVAVQLSDQFGLAGVRLSARTENMGRLEIFGLGDPPAEATPRLDPPPHLAAGDTASLSLQRGGRSVAILDLLAGRPLDARDLESLGAVGELVASAVVNSSLFASQQQAVARLRELDTLKTVFLGTASHELRTPATAIGGFASLLSDSWDRFSEAERQDMAKRIAANARSLNAVVDDLLDFSLLDRGETATAVQELDLSRRVMSVLDRLAMTFDSHEIALDIEEAVVVAAEEHGVERILTNLLTNAIKFSPAGSTVTVGVHPAGDAGGGRLTVADQGPGVPADDRQRVFSRFYRGSGDVVVQTRGVGIGLSVVSELVDRVGGTIAVGEAPGGGALFTVWFPGPSAVAEDDQQERTGDEVADATKA